MLRTTLAVSLFLASALGAEPITIKSLADFNTFKANPANYDPVYLETDLDFTGKTLTPISGFAGAFYGNGHVIKNIEMTSAEQNVGIFGTLEFATIRDLIIDDSCSFKSTYASTDYTKEVDVGSVVGQCARCTFENIINRAPVSYEPASTHSGKSYVGGIAGTFSSTSTAKMVNVANYGNVTNKNSETRSSNEIGAGGIAGFATGPTNNRVEFINCLNYGKVTNENTEGAMSGAGGIVGMTHMYIYITNCFSAGEITASKISEDKVSGAFVGYGSNAGKATFSECYVAPGATIKHKSGDGVTSYVGDGSDADELDTTGNFDALNSNGVLFYNPNKVAVTFHVNKNNNVVLSSLVVPQPVLTNRDGYTFKSWYVDDYCNKTFVGSAVDKAVTLHGGWERTLSFNTNGGDTISENTIKVIFGHKYAKMLTTSREGYTFAGWTDEVSGGIEVNEETVLEKDGDVTVYAQWTINKYTVTYILNNGTEDVVQTYEFNEVIQYIENPTWFEWTFVRWVIVEGDNTYSTYEGRPMPADNITLNATWNRNQYDVIFVMYNGNQVRTLDYDAEIPYNEIDTSREGYTFMGWNDTIQRVPSGGVAIGGSWEINTYSITFDFDNGTEPLVVELKYGATIEYPKNSTKKGHIFNRWRMGSEAAPKTMPAKNITVTVEYSQYVARFQFTKDGKNVTTIEFRFTETEFTLPKGPKKTLYKFDGWCTKDKSLCDPKLEDLPEGGAEFEATYKIDPLPVALIAVAAFIVVVAAVVGFLVWFIKRKKSRARRKVPKKKDVEMDS